MAVAYEYTKCCSVTLGDEQAKQRGVQKSVRERAGPPTFECCIEMEDRQQWNIYEDVASATDALLAGVLPGCLQACAVALCCSAMPSQSMAGQDPQKNQQLHGLRAGYDNHPVLRVTEEVEISSSGGFIQAVL